MSSNPASQFDRCQFRKYAALLLVLVLAVCGVAEAAHIHQSGADHNRSNDPASSCSLCLAAHSPAQKTDVAHAPVLSICSVLKLAPEPQLQSRLIIFSPLIRPPPIA